MRLTEAIEKAQAAVVVDREGHEWDTKALLESLTTPGSDLHRMDPTDVLEVDGKKLICRIDSQGRMRRDRWVYEVKVNGVSVASKTENEEVKVEKESDMKAEKQEKKTASRAKKPMTLIREQLKKKDNRNGTHPCVCGCGENCDRLFRQGHDAKLKSQILQFVRKEGPKPSTLAQKAVQEYLAIAPWMTAELKKAVLN